MATYIEYDLNHYTDGSLRLTPYYNVQLKDENDICWVDLIGNLLTYGDFLIKMTDGEQEFNDDRSLYYRLDVAKNEVFLGVLESA